MAYTFGGLATDDRARVLRGGAPIPGLYAAGEITGHFYATAPNAVSVLRAFVFGRIAGSEAVASAHRALRTGARRSGPLDFAPAPSPWCGHG